VWGVGVGATTKNLEQEGKRKTKKLELTKTKKCFTQMQKSQKVNSQ